MRKQSHKENERPRMTARLEYVTPSMATKYLATNIEGNRRLRRKWGETLKHIHESGQFQVSHQAIAFNDDDQLFDGQHRLTMIVQTGKPVWLLVVRNVPKAAMMVTDMGSKRTPADQIAAMGWKHKPTSEHIAIARCMCNGTRDAHGTILPATEEIVEFLGNHWEAIVFSMQHRVKGGCRAAPVRAAIARAYYHLQLERLEEYLVVFSTMLANSPRDHAAVNFRIWCEKPENRHIISGGASSRVTLYRYAAASILAFFKGHVGKSLTPVEPGFPLWPIPEDQGRSIPETAQKTQRSRKETTSDQPDAPSLFT